MILFVIITAAVLYVSKKQIDRKLENLNKRMQEKEYGFIKNVDGRKWKL